MEMYLRYLSHKSVVEGLSIFFNQASVNSECQLLNASAEFHLKS